MSDDQYVLMLTTFPEGMNIYTGTMQGGHTYAEIRDNDFKTVAEIERMIDAEFQATIPEGDLPTYRLGRTTSRLLTEEEAIRLACEWMSANRPEGTLTSKMYWLTGGESGHTYYPKETS